MAADPPPETAGVEDTPTYGVAMVALLLIVVSLAMERAFHKLKQHLKTNNRKPLRKALEKLTDELMLLGFISLLIIGLQGSLARMCVPTGLSTHMLPCSRRYYQEELAPAVSDVNLGKRLMNHYRPMRLLAESQEGSCQAKGQVPLVSLETLHQLHIFVFVLAITHVCYSVGTVILGFARLRNWRHWEEETRHIGYDGNEDLYKSYSKRVLSQRPRLVGISGHAKAFGERHTNHGCYENPISLWVLCFFQQFFASVSREDYMTLRVAFVNKHKVGEHFNFRQYVIRSMEGDFENVIGISSWLWLFVVVFLLLNVHGFYTYFWAAFIPMILVLAIGTKQQHIISTLALQAKTHVAQTMPKEGEENITRPDFKDFSTAINPSDELFWFNSPKLLRKLIHFIIFQNSFELAVFFWLLTSFGWHSCILGNHTLLIIRLVVGISTQLLASYGTLPIYALVAQMGSTIKQVVFTENVLESLKGWRKKAQFNRERRSSAFSFQGNPEQVSLDIGASNKGISPEQSMTHQETAVGGTNNGEGPYPSLATVSQQSNSSQRWSREIKLQI